MNTSSSGFPVNRANAPVTDTPIDQLSDKSSPASLPDPRVLVICSSCKATLSVRRARVGNPVKCKQCGQIFTVPAEVGTGPIPVVDHNLGFLASERDELTALVQVSRDENRDLHRDLQAACQERERLSQELAQCRNDLCMAQADLHRSSSERQSALESVEQLTKTLAERDLTHCNQRDQFDAEVEKNHQALGLAERTHLDERERLTAELAALRARHQLIVANLNPPEAPLASSDTLEAARAQAEEAKYVEEADFLYRVMAETLHGIGIHFDVPDRPHD